MVQSGPTFERAKVDGSSIVLTFDNVGTGLRVKNGTKLDEFAIAGEDRRWHWAEAEIVGRNRVKVWSPAVQKPAAVRYAFNNNPKNPNLTNETGLPAAPFRTDNFPGPTDGKR
jgi:sialate O-acetylesterase